MITGNQSLTWSRPLPSAASLLNRWCALADRVIADEDRELIREASLPGSLDRPRQLRGRQRRPTFVADEHAYVLQHGDGQPGAGVAAGGEGELTCPGPGSPAFDPVTVPIRVQPAKTTTSGGHGSSVPPMFWWIGTAYRIRTGDLRLERAVSWASRRMRHGGTRTGRVYQATQTRANRARLSDGRRRA